MEGNKPMQKVSIAEVLSALDSQIAIGAVLIGGNMDANEVARLYHSTSPGDEEELNKLKEDRKIIYFFSHEDCPILSQTSVNLLVIGRLYIVKLI